MNQNLVVVKGNQIIQASYRLTLVEQRIILGCIAKIDSTEKLSETQGFTIHVSEIRDLVSDSKTPSSYSEIKEAVDRLYNRTITIDGEGSERRWIYEKKYNKNEGSVTLYFSPTLIPYLSQLKGNFTKYRLEWVKKFSSPHSIRLYELLVQWQSKGEREVALDWLKNILELSDKYPRTNNFIQRVIKPSIAEINQHSNLKVVFGTRKAGKTITHLQFKFDIQEPQKAKEREVLTIDQFVRQNPGLTKGKSELEVRKMMLKSK
jgi:plasmid replication initiation protein